MMMMMMITGLESVRVLQLPTECSQWVECQMKL